MQDIDPEAIRRQPAWQAFLSRLEATGFFRGTLPGSVVHGCLLQQAMRSYCSSGTYQDTSQVLTAPAAHVKQLLQEPADDEAIARAAKGSEDSTTWLSDGQVISQLSMSRGGQRYLSRSSTGKDAGH